MSIFGTESEGDFAAEVAKAAEAEKTATPEISAPESASAPTPEKVPEQQVAPEAAPQNPGTEPVTAKSEKEPERFVPLAAMQEERTKRQQLERDFQNLNQAFQQFQYQLQQPQQVEQQPDPLDVDPNAEPFELINNLRNEVVQWREAKRMENETNQIKGAYLHTINSAVSADPTFKDAYNHLVQSRLGELTAMGYSPHQANETIKQEELHLARTAFMSGRNPADVIMGYSRARGFAPKAKEPDPAAQVAAQAAKEAAATSISAGGKPPKNDPTVADLASLRGAAFDAAWDKFAKEAGKSSSLFRH